MKNQRKPSEFHDTSPVQVRGTLHANDDVIDLYTGRQYMYTSGIALTVGLGERQWRCRVGVALRRWCCFTHTGNEVCSYVGSVTECPGSKEWSEVNAST